MAIKVKPDKPDSAKKRTSKWSPSYNDSYLAKNNVAVVQGHEFGGVKCGGVYSIDFDGNENTSGDALAEKFIKLNPAAAWSFRTAGSKGCNIHFVADDDFKLPPVTHLYDENGDRAGELRSSSCYTLVQGKHPSGCSYRAVVDAPAFNINPDQLQWVDNRNLIEHTQYRKSLQRRERELKQHPISRNWTQDTPETVVGGFNASEAERIAHEILLKHLPTARGQSDVLHWEIAGELLALGCKFSHPQILALGRQWYDLAKHNLDPSQSREQYASNFHRRFKSRRFPAGCGDGTFTMAVEAAREEDAPELIVDCYPHSKDIQFAATLCRELASRTSNGVFFLSARDLQEVLEVNSPQTAHNILRKLIDTELIAITRMHSRASKKATEYRYTYSDMQPLLEVVAATSEVAA